MKTTTPNSTIRTSVLRRMVRLARCDCSARESFGSCFSRFRGMILRAMFLPFCPIVKTRAVYNSLETAPVTLYCCVLRLFFLTLCRRRMQICNQVGNTLLDCTDHFAEDAALFRRIDLRLIGSGEIDVDDLLLRGLAQSQL